MKKVKLFILFVLLISCSVSFAQKKQNAKTSTFAGIFIEGRGGTSYMDIITYTFKDDKGKSIEFIEDVNGNIGKKAKLIICEKDKNGMSDCSTNKNSLNKKFKVIYKVVKGTVITDEFHGNVVVSITLIKGISNKGSLKKD